jgi:Ca-activated chloride channel homolog
MSQSVLDPTTLPRPTVRVTPATPAYPAEGGRLDLLIDLSVEFPPLKVDRLPLDVALVIDRSGSMSGPPLAGAKLAAEAAVSMLMPGDFVSVVTYDSQIDVVVPRTRLGDDRRAIVHAIRSVREGGTTALHAGWTEGVTQVLSGTDEATVNRVVLLTDGLANVGVVDPSAIVADVRAAAGHGVTTSAYGLGAQYSEQLLRAMADAGNGFYAFIEGPAQLTALFQQEVAGLSALRGRSVRLRSLGNGAALSALAPGALHDERGLALPDLVAGFPVDVLVEATLEAGAPPPTLVLEWDDVLTGARESVHVPVAVEAKPAAEVAALPVTPRVAEMRVLLELATEKDRAAEAARHGDDALLEASLKRAEDLLREIAPGEVKERERAFLADLRQRAAHGEHAIAAKMAMHSSYARSRSMASHKMAHLIEEEAHWRQQKLASMAGAGAARPATGMQPLVGECRVRRADGGTATLQVVVGDITDEHVDAVVNSTNRGLFGRSGVDGALHRRGGPELTAAARSLGTLDYGAAVFTPGFRLPARFVIHTATTAWGTTADDAAVLRSCYAASFALADGLSVRSIALPAIGTGTYAYPVDVAATVAVSSALQWLQGRGRADLVRFVILDPTVAAAFGRLVPPSVTA